MKNQAVGIMLNGLFLILGTILGAYLTHDFHNEEYDILRNHQAEDFLRDKKYDVYNQLLSEYVIFSDTNTLEFLEKGAQDLEKNNYKIEKQTHAYDAITRILNQNVLIKDNIEEIINLLLQKEMSSVDYANDWLGRLKKLDHKNPSRPPILKDQSGACYDSIRISLIMLKRDQKVRYTILAEYLKKDLLIFSVPERKSFEDRFNIVEAYREKDHKRMISDFDNYGCLDQK